MPDLIPQHATVGNLISGATGDKLTAAAQKYGVDPALVHSLAYQESGGSQAARSPKGAIGVMQLMPHTAASLNVDPTDETQNIDGGVRYLSQMMDKYGDQDKALAAYNAGPAAVDHHNGVPPYKETQNYVKSINSRLPDKPAETPAPAPAAAPLAQAAPEAIPQAAQAAPEALPQGAQVGDPIEQDAKVGAQNAPAEMPSINPNNPNFHPWDYVNTPTADLITGQHHYLKNKLNSVFTDASPEDFQKNHPWLSTGENVAEGLTSPLGVVLAAGGPLTEGAEALPVVGKYLAPVLGNITKAANLGVATEGGINAAKGISDISQHGANAGNIAQTGLSTAQALLGLHGGIEMSNTALPEDVLQNLKSKGINPTLGVASQNPIVQQGEDVLSKSLFGAGPLRRNYAANQEALEGAFGDTSTLAKQQARAEITEAGQAARTASSKAADAADAVGDASLSATDLAEKQMRSEMMTRVQNAGHGFMPTELPNPLENLFDRQGQPYNNPEFLNAGNSQPFFVPRPGMGVAPPANPALMDALEQARNAESSARGSQIAAKGRLADIVQAGADKKGLMQYIGPKAGKGTSPLSLGNIVLGAPHLLSGPHGLAASIGTGIGENVLSRLLTNPQVVWALTHTSQSKDLLTALTQDLQQHAAAQQ